MTPLELGLSASTRSVSDARSQLGRDGERIAADHLEANGYSVILKNFKVPVGRNSKGVQVTGEIDIIASYGDTLCFVEVKTRRSDEFVPISANVDIRKQRQITRTAKIYRRIFNIRDLPFRFDVVTVLMPAGGLPQVEVIKGMWTEAKFRKQQWQTNTWDEFA